MSATDVAVTEVIRCPHRLFAEWVDPVQYMHVAMFVVPAPLYVRAPVPDMLSCSGIGQCLFHLGGAGHVKRCHSATVPHMGIGPVPNEKPDDLNLSAVDGSA